ncbi:hypothetical protein QQS21_005620 [Conoideocrella luteorostrata]|uniref:RING-type E3 ubiquitin transferase n=1 Tax=Conoideocrella luteorostrata TaxID=1105319 RepID=A0AAJ0G0T8_9HYPO|nr:hypothetical protein QQS21_005620 [Conoideocrella luteorostrata]
MRPPRVAILVFFLAASLFILYRGLTTTRTNVVASYPTAPRNSKSVFGFMYYNTPFSLFPPNAAISLTDDNSTSFAARPAAFGPKLASRGLSGQLWVGSGFGEDSLDTDGELGCSDLPGWGSSNTRASLKNSFKVGATRVASVKSKVSKNGGSLLDPDNRDAIAKAKAQSKGAKNDNTDDYLTQEISGTLSRREASSGSSAHADIQSIQEAAEIEGKIVLLKRGGCGFLEKVMWAQRRGAVAVIVGDNQKGGPLIQMFAHGDEVDNVTVPSVFTARTTAQLLSSLTQPGSFIEDTIDDNGNPALKVQQSATAKHKKRSPAKSRTTAPKAVDKTKAKRATDERRKQPASVKSKSSESRGLLAGVFRSSPPRLADSEGRPSSSGRLDWVLVEDWNDEKDKIITNTLGKTKKPNSNGDGFVIGVHDWRDPDLVGNTGKKNTDETPTAKQSDTSKTSSGGSRVDAASKGDESDPRHPGLISKLFGGGGSNIAPTAAATLEEDVEDSPQPPSSGAPPPHQGLWVTITPTSSATPFFDTLLVLVISPLVTLTVVYALLVLRARIRRRRWRAPKSVVDQLPVRTYHTVATSSSNLSPMLPSPTTATPTTPLLQHAPSRSRPRSRTTTGVMESPNLMAQTAAIPTPQESSRTSHRTGFERGAGGFSAEWRKYMGRQVECVVCLEEYVDGVSRVMSLPCGHEFHADCITPWLTTRRRTCPICKGDVVRSLQRGKGSGPRYEPYRENSDDDDDDDEVEGSGSGSADRNPDLEQGVGPSDARGGPQSSNRESGWLGLLSTSFNNRPRPERRSTSAEQGSR